MSVPAEVLLGKSRIQQKHKAVETVKNSVISLTYTTIKIKVLKQSWLA